MVERSLSIQEKREVMDVARKIWTEAMRKIGGNKGSFVFQPVYDTTANRVNSLSVITAKVIIHSGPWNEKDTVFNRQLGGASVDLVIGLRSYEYDPKKSASERLITDDLYSFSVRAVEKEGRGATYRGSAEKLHPDKSDLEHLLKIILSINPQTPVTAISK